MLTYAFFWEQSTAFSPGMEADHERYLFLKLQQRLLSLVEVTLNTQCDMFLSVLLPTAAVETT